MAHILTWIGGKNGNDAASALNWQPQLAPAVGDTLSAPSGGTINISGNALQGDELDLGGNTGGVTTVLNIAGDADFNLVDYINDHTYLDMANGSRWTGTLHAMPGSMQFINWPGTMVNNGISSLWDSETTISANVVGNGSFLLTDDAFLQLQGTVSAGQTVDLNGIGPGPVGDADQLVTLSLTSPSQFNGVIDMDYGEVLLGVKADSYTYQNGVLSLWSGNTVVDTLRLTNAPDTNGTLNPLKVYETQYGTNVENAPPTAFSTGYNGGGTLLPEHIYFFPRFPIPISG